MNAWIEYVMRIMGILIESRWRKLLAMLLLLLGSLEDEVKAYAGEEIDNYCLDFNYVNNIKIIVRLLIVCNGWNIRSLL